MADDKLQQAINDGIRLGYLKADGSDTLSLTARGARLVGHTGKNLKVVNDGIRVGYFKANGSSTFRLTDAGKRNLDLTLQLQLPEDY